MGKIPSKAQYITDNIIAPYRAVLYHYVIWQLSLYRLIY